LLLTEQIALTVVKTEVVILCGSACRLLLHTGCSVDLDVKNVGNRFRVSRRVTTGNIYRLRCCRSTIRAKQEKFRYKDFIIDAFWLFVFFLFRQLIFSINN
jgi:hypothetical protein